MRKSNLVKAMACFMAATMAVTCVPGVNVTNGVSAVLAAEEETAAKPVLTLQFEGAMEGAEGSKTYTENDVTFDVKGKAEIVANPNDANEKVLHIGGSGAAKDSDNGYIITKKDSLSKMDFSNGFSIDMDIMPDAPASDFDYMFGLGYVEEPGVVNKEAFLDGTIGFIMRAGAPYKASFPNDGWQEGNPVNSDYAFFVGKKNQWYHLTYVYGKDGNLAMYVNGILTVKYSVPAADIANILANLKKGNLTVGCGIDPALEHTPAYYNNVKIYNTALTAEQAYAVAPSTTCDKIAFAAVDQKGTSASAPERLLNNTSYDIEVALTGTDPQKAVSDHVTASAISLDAAQKIKAAATTQAALAVLDDSSSFTDMADTVEKDLGSNKGTVTVTPKKSGKGAVVIACGEAKPIVYYFEAASNFCDSFVIEGTLFKQADKNIPVYTYTGIAGRPVYFTVAANGANKKEDAKLDGTITATAAGIKYVVDRNTSYTTTAVAATSGAVTVENGTTKQVYLAGDIKEGTNVFMFEYKDAQDYYPLVVVINGEKGIGGTTVPSDTVKPDDSTQTTGSAVKPDDSTQTTGSAVEPDDNTAPSDTDTNNTAPSDTDNNDSTDDGKTETTASKKKAKLVSVTAKKGKKVVSGTVKISSTGKKVKNATVKVYLNGKKKKTADTNKNGKFSVKLSKKLKKGDKVKLVVTKSTIKKVTKTVNVK